MLREREKTFQFFHLSTAENIHFLLSCLILFNLCCHTQGKFYLPCTVLNLPAVTDLKEDLAFQVFGFEC